MLVGFAGCASSPKTGPERAQLESSATDTVSRMVAADPDLGALLDRSVGYAVFPEIGKGALIVGGATGNGVLYENGVPVGYVMLDEASIGLQAGGETFSELIVFETPEALAQIKGGDFEVSGKVSATALTTGAAAGARFEEGVAVFVLPKGGLMVDISVGGQQIKFKGKPDRG
jgi:lipid-binding SYLF domain-containing protein